MLKRLFVIGCVALAAANVFAMGQMPSAGASGGLTGKPAPEFTLEHTSGGQKTLREARNGKKSVIFFWATWCPHCHDEILHISNNLATLNQKGIQVVLVDMGEGKEEVQEYLLRNKVGLDSFIDGDNSLQGPYGIIGIPTLFFVDEKGIVRNLKYEFPPEYEELFNGT